MSSLQEKLAEQQLKRQAQMQAYLTELENWVKKNFPNAQKTESGLYYVVTKKGTGSKTEKGKNTTVHYTGKLTDGSVFDTSKKRGQPFTFKLGAGQVIASWDEGVALLNGGDHATLICPYFLAYGEGGYPPVIPARATLVFDVEVI